MLILSAILVLSYLIVRLNYKLTNKMKIRPKADAAKKPVILTKVLFLWIITVLLRGVMKSKE